MKESISKYFLYIILGVLIYVPIFGHLGTLPIRVWDESRLAINAYEMYKNGDFIVTYFEGVPDMWNTKPPLLIWLQVFFIKILGVNEIAIRLPSAIAAFFTCIVLLIFSHHFFKNNWFGFISVLVLITCYGYINHHVTRTGDYDSLLTLFTTLSGLLFFAFCETKKNKYLYLFFLFLTLSVLTKSVVGLLFLPAFFIYSIIQKQLVLLLKNKHFYLGLCFSTCLILGYYLFREFYNSGYIKQVMENELGGRYLSVIEKHKHGFWYYYNNFINFQITDWYLLIPCGLAVGFFIKDNRTNRITLFSGLILFTFFLIISNSQTKLEWYDAPMYPFLSIVITVFIYYIFGFLQNNKLVNQTMSVNVIPFIFLFLITIIPYRNIINKTYKPKEQEKDKCFYEISYFLKEATTGKHNLNGQYLLYDGYYAHNLFYINALNDKNINVSFKNWRELNPNDIVFTHQNDIKQYIENHYKYKIIQIRGNIITYKINGD